MERTSGTAGSSDTPAGTVSDLAPSPFAARPAARNHSAKPSPRRDWQHRAAAAFGPRLDVRVGPDLAGLNHGQRPREARTRDELYDARLAQAKHLDQFGHRHDRRLILHAQHRTHLAPYTPCTLYF